MASYVIVVKILGQGLRLEEMPAEEHYLAGAIHDSMWLTEELNQAQLFKSLEQAEQEKEVRLAWTNYAFQSMTTYRIEEVTI